MTQDPAHNEQRTLDLEACRLAHGLTYQALADLLGLSQRATARRYAVGAVWPEPELLEKFRACLPELSVEAMHLRRLAYVRGSKSHCTDGTANGEDGQEEHAANCVAA